MSRHAVSPPRAGANIERCLVLSTAHMPESEPDFGDLRGVRHQYGWIVFLPDREAVRELRVRVPSWLSPIVEHALAEPASLINFDRDADLCPPLPTFDW